MKIPGRMLLGLGVSYLLGSLPSAYLLSRFMGKKDPDQWDPAMSAA